MLAIVTPDEMAAIDAAAPEPVEELIERAGWAVARAALDLLGGTYGRRVVVVAGKGNNGADGRAAARFLARRGVRTSVLDAAALGPGALLPVADLVIDAAYGTGFRGTWTPPRLPGDRPPVLAVDVPSGVSGLTGDASGAPWAAASTVTFAALKPGLLLGDGPSLVGDVTVADIGLDTSSARAHLVEDRDLGTWLPARSRDAHKWRAAVWVVAGSSGMTGAAHLAAAAAQRAGAGYVRLSSPGLDPAADPATTTGAPTEAVLTALPRVGWASLVLADADRFAALALGPGLGTDGDVLGGVGELIAAATVPVVVDGDGLRALGDAGSLARTLGRRGADAGAVVLTPHDGEFERLTGARPGPDRFDAARSLARASGATVLLKGATTVVAAPDGAVLATTAGDARLATAGTGDVLTGIIAALLARGLDGPTSAAAGAHLHALSARLGPAVGLVAHDVVDALPRALEALGRSWSCLPFAGRGVVGLRGRVRRSTGLSLREAQRPDEVDAFLSRGLLGRGAVLSCAGGAGRGPRARRCSGRLNIGGSDKLNDRKWGFGSATSRI